MARACFLLLVAFSAILPRLSARKAWRCGRSQHRAVPGPNSGWPEAAMAGALGVRLVGPLYKGGVLVCDLWLGDAADPEGAGPGDIRRGYSLLVLSTFATLAAGWAAATLLHG